MPIRASLTRMAQAISPARTWIGTLVFLFLAPGVVAGLVPWLISGWRWYDWGDAAWVVLPIAWIGMAAGVAFLLHAFTLFARHRGTPAPVVPTATLVVTGVYRYVRNPMYLAVLAIILGQALLFGSWGLVLYAAIALAAVVTFVKGYEEPTLTRTFGEQYLVYRRNVPGWWPRFPPWRAGDAQPAVARDRSAGALLITGGLLGAALWLVFTTSHGPTSFNENRSVLGGSMLFWGMLLGGIPNLLVAVGLVLLVLRRQLATGRWARVGFVLTLVGLVVPALIDLSIQGLGAPFFLPVQAIGLILLGLGCRSNPRVSRPSRLLLVSIGALLAIAFAWALLPSSFTDPLGGYRIYGVLAHLGAGIGWALLGISVWRTATHGGGAGS
jgi:protein-S-isoprenylcysteine O-methyltransferase Ste14